MRTSDRRKYLIPPASQPDSIIMALETRSEARLPACHAIVAPMRERHTRSPGIADVPLRSPSAAAEGKMPFPPSNGAFGTAWKHVPPGQGMPDRMKHRRPARRREAEPELQKQMGSTGPVISFCHLRLRSQSGHVSQRRRWARQRA